MLQQTAQLKTILTQNFSLNSFEISTVLQAAVDLHCSCCSQGTSLLPSANSGCSGLGVGLHSENLIFHFNKSSHRIEDPFELEGTLKGHLVPILCCGVGHLQLSQVVQSLTSPGAAMAHWTFQQEIRVETVIFQPFCTEEQASLLTTYTEPNVQTAGSFPDLEGKPKPCKLTLIFPVTFPACHWFVV